MRDQTKENAHNTPRRNIAGILRTGFMLAIAMSSLALGTNSFFNIISGRGNPAPPRVDFKYFEERYKPIAKFTDASERLGYYSDLSEGPEKSIRFLYMRMLLAPRVFNYEPEGNALVADLSGGATAPPSLLRAYAIENDFGDGLYLLRKRAR